MARELILDVVARKNSKDLLLLAQEFEALSHEIDGANKSATQNVTFGKFLDEQIASTKKQVQELTDEFNRSGNADVFGQLRGAQRNLTVLERYRRQLGDVGGAQQEVTRDLEGSEKVLRGLADEYQNLGTDVRRTEQDYKDLTDRIKTQTETVRQLERESRAGNATPFNVAYYREATRSLDDLKAQAEDLKAALVAAPEDAAKKFKSFDTFVASEIAQQRKFVEDLQRDLARTGNVSLFKPLKDAQGDLQALEEIKKAFGTAGEESGKSFLGGLGKAFGSGRSIEEGGLLKNVLLTPQAIGGAAVVASAAGVTIGGALLAGLGTAGVGAGVALELKDPKVHAALEDFKAEVGTGLHGAASVFAQPLQDAIGIFKSEFENDLPGIQNTFKALAPEVTVLAHGAAGFAGGLITGLEHAAVAAKPLLDDLGSWLPSFGKEVGGVFDTIGSHQKEALDGLHNIEAFLGGLTTVAKGTVVVLSDVDDALRYIPGSYQNWQAVNYQIASFASGVSEADLKSRLATFSSTGLRDAFRQEAAAGGQAAFALQKVNDALETNIQKNLSAADAALAAKQSFFDLSDAIKQNGDHWNDNSQAALNNQQALLRAIDAQDRERISAINGGEDAVTAAAQYNEQVDALLAIAQKAGDSKAALDKLKGTYEIDIDEVRRQYFINEGNADPSQFHHGLAGGGPVNPGQVYLVGENGPELFMSNTAGQIIPNGALGSLSGSASFRASSAASAGATITFAGDTDGAFATAFQMLVRTGAIRIS